MTQESLLACVMSVRLQGSGGAPNELESLERVVAGRGGRVIQIDSQSFFGILRSASVTIQVSVALARFAAQMDQTQIQIGICAGSIFLAGKQCTGQATVEASLLRDAASQETPILLSREVRRFLLSEESVPELRKQESGHYAVNWKETATEFSLPLFLVPGDQPMVGRTAELRALKLCVSPPQDQPMLVTVVGEAGIGKTRLLSEFALFAANQGARVLGGQEHEGLGQPYASFHDCLSLWLNQVDHVALQSLASVAQLEKIVPEISERLYGLKSTEVESAETEKQRLFDALVEWLGHLAAAQPTVLILDSLHWASDSTLKLIEGVIANLDQAPVTIVLASREEDPRIKPLTSLAADQWGLSQVKEISLGTLTRDDIRVFYGNTLSDELADFIHVTTQGRPLHLVNLMDFVSKGIDLPESLETALQARFEELPAAATSVLQACAVCGPRFTARVIADVNRDPLDVFEALDRATELGLIKLVDSVKLKYQFAHSLIRAHLLKGVGAARLAHLHARAAEAFQLPQNRELASPADLARLYAGAISLGYVAEAAMWAALAADAALNQHANEEARDMYESALGLQPDQNTSAACRLKLGLGIALARIGDTRSDEVLWQTADLAESLGDGVLMARAMLSTYRLTFSRGRDVELEAVERLKRALAMLPAEETALATRVTALLAVELTWLDDRNQAVETSQRALELARSESSEILAEVQSRRLWVFFHPIEQRLKENVDLLKLVAKAKDPVLQFEAAGHGVFTAVRIGQRAMLDQNMESMRASARVVNDPSVRSMWYLRESAVALLEARYTDSLTYAQRRLELTKRTGQREGKNAFRIQTFWVAYETVDKADMLFALEKLLAILPGSPLEEYAIAAHVAADCQESALVQPLLERFASFEFAHDQTFLWLNCLLVEPAIAVCDQGLIDRLTFNLSDHHSEHANTVFTYLGPVARYLGLLEQHRGNNSSAETLFRQSARSAQDLKSKFWASKSKLNLAAVSEKDCESLTTEVAAQSSQYGWKRLLSQSHQLAAKV